MAKLLKCLKIRSGEHWVNFIFNIIESSFIILAILFYTLFVFYDFYYKTFFQYFNLLLVIIFTVNIVIKVNTTYFDFGIEVNNR